MRVCVTGWWSCSKSHDEDLAANLRMRILRKSQDEDLAANLSLISPCLCVCITGHKSEFASIKFASQVAWWEIQSIINWVINRSITHRMVGLSIHSQSIHVCVTGGVVGQWSAGMEHGGCQWRGAWAGYQNAYVQKVSIGRAWCDAAADQQNSFHVLFDEFSNNFCDSP